MERDSLWAVAIDEAARLRVRIVTTRHLLCRMDRYDARLLRHAPERGGSPVVLVYGHLSADEAASAVLTALAAVSQRAWRAWAEHRMGRVGA